MWFRTLLCSRTRPRSRSSSNCRPAGCRGVRLAVELLEERCVTSTVTIDPNGYLGRYIVSGNGDRTGQVTLDLAPGTYSIDNNSSIGGSAFSFDVSATGQVTSNN